MIKIESRAFRDSMKVASRALGQLVLQALERTGQLTATYAKLSTLYKQRTHALRSSIRPQFKGPYEIDVLADAKHARWVEEGTRAHEILPRRKKMLRFTQNGNVVFRRRVFHPGTQPRPFMAEAAKKAEPFFDRLCREAVDRMFG